MYSSTDIRCVWYFTYHPFSVNYRPLSEEASIFTAYETRTIRKLNEFLRRLLAAHYLWPNLGGKVREGKDCLDEARNNVTAVT